MKKEEIKKQIITINMELIELDPCPVCNGKGKAFFHTRTYPKVKKKLKKGKTIRYTKKDK